MPTRNARNGMLFTRQGTLNMRNKKWEADFSPLDPTGTADVDQRYSKAYVRHLFRAGRTSGLAHRVGSQPGVLSGPHERGQNPNLRWYVYGVERQNGTGC